MSSCLNSSENVERSAVSDDADIDDRGRRVRREDRS